MPRIASAIVSATLFFAPLAWGSSFQDALRSMARGDYLSAASRLAGIPVSRPDVYLAGLARGRALFLAGHYAQARKAYEAVLEKARKGSPYAHKAKFGMAECLAAAKQFEQAERLFAEGLTGLTSEARRRAIAGRFAQLGDENLEPPEGRAADPARAEQFFRAAIEVGATGELAEQIKIKIGRSLAAQKRHLEAARYLESFCSEHDKSPRLAEARYLSGKAFLDGGRPDEARRAFTDLLVLHPKAAYAPKAAFLLSRTFGMPKPKDAHDLSWGLYTLGNYILSWPKDEHYQQARLEEALAPLNAHRQAEAEQALKSYIAKGGPADNLASARYHLGEALAAQKRYREAAGAFRDYLQKHPAHGFWLQARQGIENMAFSRADEAFKQKKWKQAVEGFGAFAAAYPAATRTPLALLNQAMAKAELDDVAGALALLTTLTTKFPGDRSAAEGWYRTGLLLEEKRADILKAREAYKKATQSPGGSAQASSRLAALDEPGLVVESPPVFQTGDRPTLTWHARNIESVKVNIYHIEAEDFFRDRMQMESVVDMDIALCAPDTTFDVPVTDYRKHIRITQKVPLKITSPGLYLAHLTAGKLEATTAVVVSDLGMIIKSGPGKIFVFSQDMKKTRPLGDVRIIVADGKRIVAEGKTGKDGVWQHNLPESESDEGLSALAIRGGHLAWTGIDYQGGQPQTAASPRAFVFTDRPAYRPGDEISIAGIVRDRPNQQGKPAYQPGDSVHIEVQLSQVRLTETAKLDEFGVFHKKITLDPAIAPGRYGISVRAHGGVSFGGSFRVQHYRLPAYDLSVSFDRPVVFRGEPLAGVIRVRHRSGAPAAFEKITYRLDDAQVWLQATCDENGQVRFSFPTRTMEQTHKAVLQIKLRRLNLQQEATALVAAEGYKISIETEQKTIFAGQPFDLRISVSAPDGSPSTASLNLRAVKRLPGTNAEVRVLERKIEVPPSGKLRLPVSLPGKGVHIVRVFGNDRAGHPITAELGVNTVGEDEPGFFLDLERTELTMGTPAKLSIRSHMDRALVLLTCETDQIIDYRTVRLKRGENKIEIPLSLKLVPNFQLSASAMHKDRLYSVSRSVRVTRKLVLTVRPDRKRYSPGDKVNLTLIARDADGHPIDARLIVAVVDESLYKVFPEGLPDLVETFQQLRPEGDIETVSSNRYRFPEVEASEVEKAEVEETEGSAAMAALGARRRKMTEKATADFSKMAKTESLQGGLVGYGMGAGGLGAAGYGRGAGGKAYMRMGKAIALGAGALRKYFSQTAAFFPDLRTGPDGVANVTFRLPDTLTSWRITTRGVTRDTQLGEDRTQLVASRPFWVELIAPPALEEGDSLQPAARVYNDSRVKLEATVKLAVAGKTFSKVLTVNSLGNAEVFFKSVSVPKNSSGKMRFELSAAAADLSDHLVRELPVVPRGVREQVLASGLLTKSAGRTMKLDEGLSSARLDLRLDARLSRIILAGELDPLLFGDRPEEALVALNILDQIGPSSDATMRDMVMARLRRALRHLVITQRSDGGWALNRQMSESDPVMTARAMRALARARKIEGALGWNFPQAGYQKALEVLKGYLVSLPPDDFVRRVEVIYALAHEGQAQIPQVHLQRMHRLRDNLPLGAKAMLGLTWNLLERPEKAAELGKQVRSALNQAASGKIIFSWQRRWSDPTCERARALELLAQVTPSDPLVERGTRWLLDGGTAFGWLFPDQAEAVTAAVGKLLAAPKQNERFRVTVSLNGSKATTLSFPSADGGYGKSLAIDPHLLRTGDNKLELHLEGSGSCFFLATLSGYRAEAKPPAEQTAVTLERHVEALPQSFRGHEIAGGFSVVSSGSVWTNEIERIPAGRRVRVTLKIKRNFASRLDHCVLSERIPPGFEMVEGSQGGSLAHMARAGRRLAFYLSSPGYIQTISYILQATNPGSYSFAPARLISVINPGTSVLSPGREFSIDPPGAKEPDKRTTPDELYHLGLAAADEKLPDMVIEKLEQLYEKFKLRENVARDVQARLLFASIELKDSQRIVKYFELAKEKNPDLVIPFDKIGPLQAAYREVGSHEAGLHLDRGVCDARFMSEVHGVGILETQDEIAEAIDLLRDQLDSYPDSEPAARATYAFSQVLFDRADRLRSGEPLSGFDRPGLIDQVVELMSRYLGLFPADPQAPAAVYSLASALLERGRPGQAIDWCQAGLHRFPETDLSPAIAYLEAFAHFKLGQYGSSLKLCRQVVDESPNQENQDMARYIMAQIYHARGELERALPLYKMVQDSFRDAEETVQESQKTLLAVPEVITVSPGERPTLTMTVRNLERINLRAYRVDPMNLYLVKGSLSDLSAVNLAGIKPVLATTLRLRKRVGITHEEKEPLRLPGKGAYLLLLHAGSHSVHSLVLLGGLSLDVTEIADQGRVRVTVRTARGRPLPGARVQLKGSQDERFIVGQTDLRGIFIASGINGAVTVIARQAGAFGLYRGTENLEGQPPEPRPTPDKSVRYRKKTTYDFEDDTINGELMQPEAQYQMNRKPAGKAEAKNFFQQQVNGMSVQQAK